MNNTPCYFCGSFAHTIGFCDAYYKQLPALLAEHDRKFEEEHPS